MLMQKIYMILMLLQIIMGSFFEVVIFVANLYYYSDISGPFSFFPSTDSASSMLGSV